MVEEKQLLLIGYPSTGKTTFIAALWHIVTNNDVPESLNLVELQDTTHYINAIYRTWSRFLPMEHTDHKSKSAIETILLTLSNSKQDEAEISFPDLSGETFRDIWINRYWDEELAMKVANADGLLFFLHPEQQSRSVTINEAEDLMANLHPQNDETDTNNSIDEAVIEEVSDDESEIISYAPQFAAKQVQFVELLQFISDSHQAIHGECAPPVRLSVIISAWDTAYRRDAVATELPINWLSRNLPFLWQYLKANTNEYDTQIWGVSGQGGQVENPDKLQEIEQEIAQLQNYHNPSERILVVGGNLDLGVVSHDISLPVKWAMEDVLIDDK